MSSGRGAVASALADRGVRDERTARAAWSRLAEPTDPIAAALVTALGAQDALVDVARQINGGAARSGAFASARLRSALARWAPRWSVLDVDQDLAQVQALDGTLVVPGDAAWPRRADDLAEHAPWCLWVRGRAPLAAVVEGAVAVVGARACTEYGTWVAGSITSDLAENGRTIVSGGAYGIDAAAHRGALAVGGPSVAFLAGGVDRLYPAGNTRLLQDLMAQGGCVVSEVPPGTVPSKHRFLLRNRLIAAFADVTVVVEAARRSGALATAHRASALLRPLGAVPGPVTSASSRGCLELIRSGEAVCVTNGAEVEELAGPIAAVSPSEPGVERDPRAAHCHDVPGGASGRAGRVRDALPSRASCDVESIARVSGLSVHDTLVGLGELEIGGVVVRAGEGWRLAPDT